MQQFFSYLKKPVCYFHNNKPQWFDLLTLFLIYLFIAIPLSGLVLLLGIMLNIEHDPINLTLQMKLMIGVILAPVYEEIVFRSLLKFNNKSIVLFIVTVISFILFYCYRQEITYVVFFSFLLLCISLILFMLPVNKIRSILSSNFKYFFYASATIFGLLHIVNFSGNGWLIMAFSFILCAPQIVLGFVLGYIRMQYGLLYCIIFHMILNLSVLVS